jgi:hypothetical protein
VSANDGGGSIVDSEQVRLFVVAGEDYCSYLESPPSVARWEILHGLHIRLAAVYVTGLQIPGIGQGDATPVADHEREVPWRDVDGWTLHKGLQNLVGPIDLTGEVYYEEAVDQRIADDLIGVYEDLKGGFEAWRAGQDRESILWEWTFRFIHHSSEHATSGMRLLWNLMRYGYLQWQVEK